MSGLPLLLSDVDDTFLCAGLSLDLLRGRYRHASQQVEVVFASSRTVGELVTLLGDLGARGDVIAENGAVLHVGDLATASAVEGVVSSRGEAEGNDLVLRLGPTVEELLDLLAAFPLRADLPPFEVAGRQASLLFPADRVPGEVDRALRTWAVSQSLFAQRGGRWISVWGGADKGEAARRYLAARLWSGAGVPMVGAVGNAENDTSLLRAGSRRWAIRNPGGHDPALLAVPGVVPLEAPGCDGWEEAVTRLIEAPGRMYA